jgi:hypothetical protein
MLRPLALLALVASGLALAACGGSASSSTSDPAASGTNGTPGVPAASGGSDAALPTSGPAGPSGTPVGTVDVRLHNTSGHDVWLVYDGQRTPLWLEIDAPPLALNGYGGRWCGDATGSHNDPFMSVTKVAAGEVTSTKWTGTYVTGDAGCLQSTYAAAGKHESRACLYDTDPGQLRITPNGISGGPSSWFVKAPSRCLPITLDLPTSGSSTVDVELQGP